MKYINDNWLLEAQCPTDADSQSASMGYLDITLGYTPGILYPPYSITRPPQFTNFFNGRIYVPPILPRPASYSFPFQVSDLLVDLYKSFDYGFRNYFDADIYGNLPSTKVSEEESIKAYIRHNEKYFITSRLSVTDSKDQTFYKSFQVFPGSKLIDSKESGELKKIFSRNFEKFPLITPLINLNDNIVIPRLPNIRTSKMFASSAIYTSIAYTTREKTIQLKSITEDGTVKKEYLDIPALGVNYFTTDLDTLYSLFGIGLATDTPIQIANVWNDETLPLLEIQPSKDTAKYYVAWLDNNFAFQCQPFDGKSIESEDLNKIKTVDAYNVSRTQYTESTLKWNVTSEYLTDEQYQVYNSIFRSPFIYLYDTENDWGEYVEVEGNSATNKKYINDSIKYMQLTLTKRNKLNI